MLVGAIAWFLALPLRDVLAYPDRVSVLPNLQADAAAYDGFARQLARDWTLEALPAKHPPGWIALLSLVYRVVGESYVAGKLVSWLALIISVVLCAWVARRIYGGPAAWVAALLCASSPALRWYVGTLQYEVVTGTLLLAVLVAAVRASEARDGAELANRSVVVGLLASWLILTRETLTAIVPLVALWIAHRAWVAAGGRSAALAGFLVLSVAALPALAWSTAQSLAKGHVVLISEKGPAEFALGNHPLANGTYNESLVGIGSPAGVGFVRQFPARALVLSGRKVLYFWGILRDGWNVPRPAAVWAWRATTGIVPHELFASAARGGWLLVAFICSLWFLGVDGIRRWWLFVAIVLALTAIHAVTLGSHRFAVPILPLTFVVISGAVAAGSRRLRSLFSSPHATGAVALVVVIVTAMQYQQWPLSLRYDAADLDGVSAMNVGDQAAGHYVRFADAKRGTRPVVLLSDEHLPKGALRIDVQLRRSSSELGSSPIARVALVPLAGHAACSRDISAFELSTDRFQTISIPCRLPADGPATLILFSLGVVDLAFDEIRLHWGEQAANP